MIIIFAALAVFAAALYYVFFISKGTEEAVQIEKVQDTSYQEYQDYISDTNKGIKNLLDGEQLKQIVINEYPAIDLNVPRSENPFVKSF